jgi:hypothetical protein
MKLCRTGLLVLGGGISISGPMLLQEAKEVTDRLGKTDFKACNRSLERFWRRRFIIFNSVLENLQMFMKKP